MRAAIFAMHKETAPPFSGGAPVENGAGLTLRRLPGDLIVCVCGVGKVNAALAAQYLIGRFASADFKKAGQVYMRGLFMQQSPHKNID